MKELKVGETINYNGHILKVEKDKEDNLCKGCFFELFLDCTKSWNIVGTCNAVERDDKTDVIFKKIEP